MNITYYKAIRNDDTVAVEGDIIKVDWDRYSDGTPAENLTQGHTYNPFRTSDRDGEIMVKISETEAKAALAPKADPEVVKLVKQIMAQENTNLLVAAGIAMRKISDATDAIRAEYETNGRVEA